MSRLRDGRRSRSFSCAATTTPRARSPGACACPTTSASSRSTAARDASIVEDSASPSTGRASRPRAVTDDLAARYPRPRRRRSSTSACCTPASTGARGTSPTRRAARDAASARATTTGRSATSTRARCSASDPWIVFPGNLQGRHARETGAEGRDPGHRRGTAASPTSSTAPLDVVRWSVRPRRRGAARARRRRRRRPARATARASARAAPTAAPLAARVDPRRRHARARRAPARAEERWANEIRAAANDLGGEVWVEKVAGARRATALDLRRRWRSATTPSGSSSASLAALRDDAEALARARARARRASRNKLPPELREGEDALRLDDPAAAPRGARATSEQLLLPRLLAARSRAVRLAASSSSSPSARSPGSTLDFSAPRPALHVVYGPNEAGKSTALRAVTGLLYGIPRSTAGRARARPADLRIGARLAGADGERLERRAPQGPPQHARSTPAGKPSTRPRSGGSSAA